MSNSKDTDQEASYASVSSAHDKKVSNMLKIFSLIALKSS